MRRPGDYSLLAVSEAENETQAGDFGVSHIFRLQSSCCLKSVELSVIPLCDRVISYSIIAISSIVEATVLCPHMTVCFRTHIKNAHTDPADMCSTRFALNMIAAFRLLNRGPTLWAILCTILLFPLLESFVANFGTFVLVAREAFMVDGSAFSAN